jgi:hypothetical protein
MPIGAQEAPAGSFKPLEQECRKRIKRYGKRRIRRPDPFPA